jgi:hypothetical protein
MLKLYAEVHALLHFFEQPKLFVQAPVFKHHFASLGTIRATISEDVPEKSKPPDSNSGCRVFSGKKFHRAGSLPLKRAFPKAAASTFAKFLTVANAQGRAE